MTITNLQLAELERLARSATQVEAVENARVAIRSYLWIMQVLAGDRATVELEIKA